MNKYLLYCSSILTLSSFQIYTSPRTSLTSAVHTNKITQVTQLLRSQTCSQENKNLALLVASKKPTPQHSTERVRLDIMSMLLAHGAQVNYATTEKKTGLANGSALFFATEEGHPERAQLLLQHEANPNWKDSRGYTPLIRAAINGDTNMVILLCQNGAHVHAQSKTESTALVFSAMRKYSELTNELLLRGAQLLPEQKINKYAKEFIEKRSNQAEKTRLSCLKKVLQTPDRLPDALTRLTLAFDGTDHLWSTYKAMD